MTAQVATLAAAMIAAVASIATLLLGSRITYNRERRQELVRAEIERMFAAEEMAGELAELVGSYQRVFSDAKRERFVALFSELDATAGKMARYPDVRQALRDLSNVCSRLFVAVREHAGDEREIRSELDPALAKLHAAIDAVVGKRALAT